MVISECSKNPEPLSLEDVLAMNDDRRKRIDEAMEHISAARELLDTVIAEEQEAFDNLAVGLQGSERGQKMEETADSLYSIHSDLEDMESLLEECKG